MRTLSIVVRITLFGGRVCSMVLMVSNGLLKGCPTKIRFSIRAISIPWFCVLVKICVLWFGVLCVKPSGCRMCGLSLTNRTTLPRLKVRLFSAT